MLLSYVVPLIRRDPEFPLVAKLMTEMLEKFHGHPQVGLGDPSPMSTYGNGYPSPTNKSYGIRQCQTPTPRLQTICLVVSTMIQVGLSDLRRQFSYLPTASLDTRIQYP